MSSSFVLIMIIFSALQIISMVALLMFIKPVSRRRFTRPPYNNDDDDDGGLGINLDDIILPPIDGITYPSQIKERELV